MGSQAGTFADRPDKCELTFPLATYEADIQNHS